MRYVLVALALALTGCGPARSGSLGPAPTGAPRSSAPASAGAPSPSTQKITVQVWFSRGGKVFPTQRTRPLTTATSRLALTELVAGPTGDEASAGVGSGVPGETVFDLKGISDGTATVSLPAAFYAGGRDAVRLRTRNRYWVARMHRGVGSVPSLLWEDVKLMVRGRSSLRGIIEGLCSTLS